WAGDVYNRQDVDNIKVRQDVFGDPIGIAAFHPDSSTPSQIGVIREGDKEIKRPIIKFTNRDEFKKRLIDLRLSSKSNVGKDLRIVVKGDKDVDLGAIQDLMDMLKETKNTRFALVTDMDKGEEKK
ncbi:MAG: ExbD/TolR family protein, partial [Ignavibacteria bacterium]